MRHRLAAALLLAAPALLSLSSLACSSATAPPSASGTPVKATATRDLAPTVAPADEASLVTGNTDFGFALYHGLSTAAGGAGTTNNLFYSPYSVSLALAMTYAGAHGETATQIATALSFTLPEATLNPAFDKLDLAIQAKPTNATGADGAPFAINLADSLWGEQTVTFGQSFVNALATNYGAGLRTVDFLNAPAAAESAINAWVATATDDKIDPLLSPGQIDPTTELVIVNAVYFNAAWATAFQKSATQPGTFTRADGTNVQTPLMSGEGVASTYFKGASYQAVEVPYSGNTASMVIVLPNEGSYAAVEKGLGGAFFDEVTTGLAGNDIVLTMPSFKIHGATVSLKPELKALGMTDAFTNGADLTTMIPAGDVHIADVLHQAFVDVDESGTEAAAATAVTISKDSVGIANPPQPIVVDVDRAFFFFIRDVATNTVLFVGRESDPTAQ